ncbi:hypothetical protein NEOKW01_0380 [Nematocida sp. AWRm80]|nr:hypothetical protein NEOKW01_0380 [Nematocida sp. AWRm80]
MNRDNKDYYSYEELLKNLVSDEEEPKEESEEEVFDFSIVESGEINNYTSDNFYITPESRKQKSGEKSVLKPEEKGEKKTSEESKKSKESEESTEKNISNDKLNNKIDGEEGNKEAKEEEEIEKPKETEEYAERRETREESSPEEKDNQVGEESAGWSLEDYLPKDSPTIDWVSPIAETEPSTDRVSMADPAERQMESEQTPEQVQYEQSPMDQMGTGSSSSQSTGSSGNNSSECLWNPSFTTAQKGNNSEPESSTAADDNDTSCIDERSGTYDWSVYDNYQYDPNANNNWLSELEESQEPVEVDTLSETNEEPSYTEDDVNAVVSKDISNVLKQSHLPKHPNTHNEEQSNNPFYQPEEIEQTDKRSLSLSTEELSPIEERESVSDRSLLDTPRIETTTEASTAYSPLDSTETQTLLDMSKESAIKPKEVVLDIPIKEEVSAPEQHSPEDTSNNEPEEGNQSIEDMFQGCPAIDFTAILREGVSEQEIPSADNTTAQQTLITEETEQQIPNDLADQEEFSPAAQYTLEQLPEDITQIPTREYPAERISPRRYSRSIETPTGISPVILPLETVEPEQESKIIQSDAPTDPEQIPLQSTPAIQQPYTPLDQPQLAPSVPQTHTTIPQAPREIHRGPIDSPFAYILPEMHRDKNDNGKPKSNISIAFLQGYLLSKTAVPSIVKPEQLLAGKSKVTLLSIVPEEITDLRRTSKPDLIKLLLKNVCPEYADMLGYLTTRTPASISNMQPKRVPSKPSTLSLGVEQISNALQSNNWAEALFLSNGTLEENKVVEEYVKCTTSTTADYLYVLLSSGRDSLALSKLRSLPEDELYDTLIDWQYILKGAIIGKCQKTATYLIELFFNDDMIEEGTVSLFLSRSVMEIDVSNVFTSPHQHYLLSVLMIYNEYFSLSMDITENIAEYITVLSEVNLKGAQDLYSAFKSIFPRATKTHLEGILRIKPSSWGLSGIISAVDKGITRIISDSPAEPAPEASQPEPMVQPQALPMQPSLLHLVNPIPPSQTPMQQPAMPIPQMPMQPAQTQTRPAPPMPSPSMPQPVNSSSNLADKQTPPTSFTGLPPRERQAPEPRPNFLAQLQAREDWDTLTPAQQRAAAREISRAYNAREEKRRLVEEARITLANRAAALQAKGSSPQMPQPSQTQPQVPQPQTQPVQPVQPTQPQIQLPPHPPQQTPTQSQVQPAKLPEPVQPSIAPSQKALSPAANLPQTPNEPAAPTTNAPATSSASTNTAAPTWPPKFVPPKIDDPIDWNAPGLDYKKIFSDTSRFSILRDEPQPRSWVSYIPGITSATNYLKSFSPKSKVPVVNLSQNAAFVNDKLRKKWIPVDSTTLEPIKEEVTQSRPEDKDRKPIPLAPPKPSGPLPQRGPDGKPIFASAPTTGLEARYGKSMVPGVVYTPTPTTLPFPVPPMNAQQGKNIKVFIPEPVPEDNQKN